MREPDLIHSTLKEHLAYCRELEATDSAGAHHMAKVIRHGIYWELAIRVGLVLTVTVAVGAVIYIIVS